jgi:hypothetical protein
MDIFTSSSADARCFVVAKYHDLEKANTKVFSEQFQPKGLNY